MKHNNKYLFSLLLLPLLGGLSFLSPQKANSVEAYTINSLPKDIYLNDCSDTEIRGYYSNLDSLGESERTGENLLKNLKPILSKDQLYYSYDSGNAIWQMYEITDRDWKKSPASEMTQGTYDAVANKITGYSYGSNTNQKDNPYIHALYINRDVENETRAWGNHEQDQWGINREHIWPKSAGFEDAAQGGARGDPMHLWAGNGYSNNIHNNYYYGYVDKNNIETDCGAKYSNQKGNLRGKSKTLGGSTLVFEPQDCDKGDIARSCFYMVARYNYLSGSDSDGIDSNNPNLELVNSLDSYVKAGYLSTTTTTGKIGLIQDLLEWNKLDPVDEYELHRNNLLYRNFTNNRNPFIDFPEWADLIWGADKNVKFAAPNSDAIARPKDFVPPTEDTSAKESDGNIIPGVPNVVLYIAAAVVAVIVIVIVIVILTKGSKKQKKALKKVAKKVVKSSSKSKKK